MNREQPPPESDKGRITPYGRVVKDFPTIEKILNDSGANVRGLISGHLHILEEIHHGGRRFICSGSVSGHQWTGPRLGCPEGFGVLDCQPDGTFQFTYRDYGWSSG